MMASYTPPQAVQRAAQRALRKRAEKPPSQRGMTATGLARARDLANGRPASEETLRRMVSYFARHEVDKQGSTWDDYGKGRQAWDGWGGDAGRAWAERTLRQIERERSREDKKMDKSLDSPHKPTREDRDRNHLGASTPAPPEDQITGSKTNPKGTAKNTRGAIKISEAAEKSLRNKVKEHNERHGDDPAKKIDLGMLKAVYRRGAGAYSVSHRPGTSRNQWAMARVNAFIYLMRRGRPQSPNYITDNDLLPKEHPRSSKGDKKMDKILNTPHRQPQPQQPPKGSDKILTGSENKADVTPEQISAEHVAITAKLEGIEADNVVIGEAIQNLDSRVSALEMDRADKHYGYMTPEEEEEEERRRRRRMQSTGDASSNCTAWAPRTRADDAPDGLQRVWRMDYISLPSAQAITTRDGFLEIKGAVVARAGVLDYRLADGTPYKELRDPDVIFAASALDSYNGRPLLEGMHPVDAQGRPTFVTGDNISSWVPVGSVRNMRPSMAVNPDTAADDFPQEYQVTRADLLIWGRQDEDTGANVTIERIRSGELREFSVGYETMIDPTPGTYMGTAYDARQVADVGNHVALVSRGRAGSVTRFRMDSLDNSLTNARRYAVRFDKCRTYAHNSRERREGRVDSKHERRADNMAQITLNGVQGEIDALLVPMVHETQKELAASQKLSAELQTQVSELTQRADEADAKLADALAEQSQQSEQAVEALEGVKTKADSLSTELDEANATIAKLNEELGAEKAKLGAAEAQVAELKEQVESAQARGDAQVDIDAAVQARIELIDDARQYLPAEYDFKGKADLTIKADAVAHVTKRSDIDDSQVEGAYKVLEMLKGRDNTSEVAEATRPASEKVAPFRSQRTDSKPRISADDARRQFLSNHRTDHSTGRNGFAG